MITKVMELERTTKGSVRYRELGSDGSPVEIPEAAMGTLYLRKTVLPDRFPAKITVTISWEG